MPKTLNQVMDEAEKFVEQNLVVLCVETWKRDQGDTGQVDYTAKLVKLLGAGIPGSSPHVLADAMVKGAAVKFLALRGYL